MENAEAVARRVAKTASFMVVDIVSQVVDATDVISIVAGQEAGSCREQRVAVSAATATGSHGPHEATKEPNLLC